MCTQYAVFIYATCNRHVLAESIWYVDSIIFLPTRSSNKVNTLLEFLSTSSANLTQNVSHGTIGTRTLEPKPQSV
jgi:hypothetical protein